MTDAAETIPYKIHAGTRDLYSILQQDYLSRGVGDRLINHSAWIHYGPAPFSNATRRPQNDAIRTQTILRKL
jgi:hypothetical protein